ncbi:MAG: PD40 domain-containing protein, partial [Bryobacterales bacterium]|nr:PD40 domain-containing protein [Bryobacterales bacterium]
AGSSPFTSNPEESAASITQFESQFQGRAPAWSPDGRYIVFESTRTNGQMALYLFDTQNPANAPVQLTDTVYGAQHANSSPMDRN